MRYRLFHKPTRTVKAGAYLLESDAYATLAAMPPLEAADYFVVVDEAEAKRDAKHCTDCRITYHNPDALVCQKCGETLP